MQRHPALLWEPTVAEALVATLHALEQALGGRPPPFPLSTSASPPPLAPFISAADIRLP